MIIFFGLLILALVLLYVNLSNLADGKRGKFIALAFLLGIFLSMSFRDTLVGESLLTFFTIWLCQALWMFIILDLVCGVRFAYRFVARSSRDEQKTKRFVRRGTQIAFGASVLLASILIAYGIPHNYDYKVRQLDVDLSSSPLTGESTRNAFTAAFFSDIHMDPLFRTAKLKRMVAELDSIKPDFILFGGDLADVPSTTLDEWGYDALLRKIAASARIAAIGINGNHEAMQQKHNPEGWLRNNGWIVLDDSTACVPAENPIACFTGRTDFQVARTRSVERRRLNELVPDEILSVSKNVPWILMDHQPKGVEPGYKGRLPDYALSGHTHDGQFFPGNLIIGLVWRLAYGEGALDGVRWLVSAGIDSWGPPVRAGSDTEMWIIRFEIPETK